MRRFIDIVENINKEISLNENDVKVWHVTERSSVPSIMQKGLIPKRGQRSQSANEMQAAIYVFPDGISLEDAISNWMGDEFEGLPLSILELSVPNDWLVRHAISWEATITRSVPPNRIRILVDDVDNWDGNYPGGNPPVGWYPLEQ